MSDETTYDGLPQARPRRLFLTIIGISLVLYIPLLLAVYVLQDESRKQLTAEGLSYITMQEYGKAVGVWQRMLARYPDAVDAYIGLGVAYTQMGEFTRAEEAFTLGLARYPGEKRLMFNRALMFMSKGDKARARTLLEELRAGDKLYPETNYHLGRLAEDAGDIQAARDLYVEELNVNAACAKAWYRLELLQSYGPGAP